MRNIQKQTVIKIIISYLAAFLIPVILLDAFVIFYASGYGYVVPNSIHYVLNMWNGLASVCFFFMLKHTHPFAKLPESFCYILSLAYGLCGYSVLQENNIRYLTIYALFPILFYLYRRMMEKNKMLIYILLLTAVLFVDYMLGAVIITTLALHTLFFSKGSLSERLWSLLKYVGCSLPAILLSGITTFPLYAQYFASADAYPYNGFEGTFPPFIALSRFLMGSVPSAAFFADTKMDLYIGLFPFVMAIFYFIQSRDVKEKLARFIFLFILFAAIEFSPIYYIANLFSMQTFSSIYYAFILIFFLLYTSGESMCTKTKPSLLQLTILSVCVFAYLTICLYAVGHIFHSTAVYSNILFAVCYVLLLFAIYLCKKSTLPQLLLIAFISLEAFCNLFITTNQNFIHAPLVLEDRIPNLAKYQGYPAFNDTHQATCTVENSYRELSTDADLASVNFGSDTATIRSEQYLATELFNILNTLPDETELSISEKSQYNINAFSDYFEIQNALCRKVGATKDLFYPVEYDLVFDSSNFYSVKPVGGQVYSFAYFHDSLYQETLFYDMDATIRVADPATVIFYDTTNMQLYQFDCSKNPTQTQVSFYLPLSPEYTINNRIYGYGLNKELLEALPSLIAAYNQQIMAEENSSIETSVYCGLIATCLGVFLMLILFFNRDKHKIYARLSNIGTKIQNNTFLNRIQAFIYDNRIYFYAFLIPFCYFVFCLIVYSCAPFGNNSIFDEDGMFLTYPANLDIYYNLKEGHALYSFLGGYGYSIYATNPLALTRIFTLLFSPEQLAAVLTIEEGIYLGLSGLSLVYYMTHRLVGTRAHKHDSKLLIAVMIYTLNNYMLCMHGFTSWYQIFPALPLLILAMDYLIIKKKCIPYIIALAYCIYANLYLALYICIFLVIRFFIYHFDDIKDFINKGLRFAACSILAALNSFFIISNTLLASSDSAYQIDDSSFPTPGLHGNFFSQWKQFMIFSEVGAVNWNENYVNLYIGIGAFILLILYCTSKKIMLTDKLRMLIPMGILLLTFNGKLLSFIWNGFHYQTGVPNRYAFLFMLLSALLVYDCLCVLSAFSIRRYALLVVASLSCLVAFQHIGTANSRFAYISSLIVLIVYLITFLIYLLKKKMTSFYKVFSIFLATEMLLNMLFSFYQYNLIAIYQIGDITAVQNYIAKDTTDSLPLERTMYPATTYKNAGSFYNTESNELFNSFVTMHQSSMNMRYGLTGGVNFTTTLNAGVPLTVALSGTKYLYYSYITENTCEDMGEYEYLGSTNDSYIFKNPYTLPLGIFAPTKAATLDNFQSFTPYFLEDLSNFYLEDGHNLFTHQLIYYDETGKSNNSFYYTDETDRILTFDEVNDILSNASKGGQSIPLDNLYINLSVTPPADGPVYLYAIEFICLGYGKEGETVNYQISYPSENLPASNDLYNIEIFHSEYMPEFYENASMYTLENIRYEGHTLTATTNYAEDGYTMLSIPYERGWKAYIDGKEVEIEDPYQSMMFVKTPAGHHELKLVYLPYGMIPSLLITGGSILFTAVLFLLISRHKRKHPNSIT